MLHEMCAGELRCVVKLQGLWDSLVMDTEACFEAGCMVR